MKTEVELQEDQSFAIAGLLDRRVTETFQKMPFIGDIPVLGKFFQSKNTNHTNTELLVIVTPEIVQPIPAAAPLSSPKFQKPFMDSSPQELFANPKGTVTPVAAKKIPIEDLMESQKPETPLDTNAVIVNPQGGMGAPSTPATTPVAPAPVAGGPD